MRELGRFLLGLYSAGLLGLLATRGGVAWLPRAAPPPGAVVEFDLTAAPVRWEIQPGLVIDGWGYNGQVPGPTLRVREGDRVRIRLHNQLPVPTSLHWHGVDVPNAMDGVPGLTQEPVPPGGEFTYEFVATPLGTRIYHSHVDTHSQLELGLYGALIIEPREPEPVRYDRDYVYLLSEKALDFTPAVALGQAQVRNAETGNGRGGALAYDLFLINGKAGAAIPPLRIAPGERIRLRLINVGHLPHSMHLHGHSFTIVATDGNPVPPAAQLRKDTVLLGPGERYDLAIEGTNPGVWMFHCHMPNHAENGMMTALVYDGYQLPGEAHAAHGAPAALPAPAPSPSPPPAPEAAGEAKGARVVAADNRFEPSAITVPVGTTVTWRNEGSNLHSVTSFDGTWGAGVLEPGQEGAYTFTAPGEYRYYCQEHLLSGMLGRIIVEPEPQEREDAEKTGR